MIFYDWVQLDWVEPASALRVNTLHGGTWVALIAETGYAVS